ncbi:MAG TPA: tripartite tricarboxylate transporter substrate binding protein, partial [Gammaproteobacteria bacterium]|nr:tripartite tricarboxylate transporter substrate binding protein [Gammaproteobacteria bacterium]
MHFVLSRFPAAAVAALVALVTSANVAAQPSYPHRVVTLVTHSSPGGGSDVFLRELARFLGPEMGVEFIVENVRGGSGARAIARLANASPDGRTFYATTPTYIYTSLLSRPAHTYRDLEPVVNVFFDEEVVYTRASGPFETLEQVVEKARTSRGRWGAANPASLERQALEQLKAAVGVTPAIVTHEGGGDLMLNVLNGTLDIGVGEAQEIRSQLEAGQLRILALFGGERSEHLPNVPTVAELGYDVVLTKFRGIAGPPGTPPEIVAAWEAGVQRVLENPEYRKAYEEKILAPHFIPHSAYGEFIESFAARTAEFLRSTGGLQEALC